MSSNDTNNNHEQLPVWLRELCERLQSDDKALLTEVNLNLRRLDRPMMDHLCRVLSRNNNDCALQSLNLTSSLVDRPEMTAAQVAEPLLLKALSSMRCPLRILHLSYNRLMGRTLYRLGESLSVNQTLTELYLDHNRIDCQTVVHLSRGLGRNQTLQVLQLSSNLIGDLGATSLADALVVNKSLRSLGLSHNVIGEPGGQAFVDALWKHKNTSLTLLDMKNNPQLSGTSNNNNNNTLGWLTTLCQANALGRKLLLSLSESSSLPGIVALLLAKASGQRSPSTLFLFLQEVQSIVPLSSSSSSSLSLKSVVSCSDNLPCKKKPRYSMNDALVVD